ncbi:MAG TPA: SDR family NAD(P)-dependent oxidoreductase [Microthrixaceae bacterium]|nr:SDR family NAD(P)-dependent oxidoreductase [Microthrixaceae bacterium]
MSTGGTGPQGVSGVAAPRTALVLGGSSDIAIAIVSELGAHGLQKVMLAVRDAESVTGSALPDGPQRFVEPWDALDIDSHDALADRAAEVLGTVDVLVCAVGMLGHHAGLGMAPEEVDQMVRTNFSGPAAAVSAIAQRMVEQRSASPSAGAPATIIVISSVAAARPRRSNFVYGSSKAGLDAFARGLGDALVGTGVRVLVVRPGFVRSRMTEGLDPAPFATRPEVVAKAVVKALRRRGSAQVVWVPSLLGPMFAMLSNVPTGLWRRISGDR